MGTDAQEMTRAQKVMQRTKVGGALALAVAGLLFVARASVEASPRFLVDPAHVDVLERPEWMPGALVWLATSVRFSRFFPDNVAGVFMSFVRVFVRPFTSSPTGHFGRRVRLRCRRRDADPRTR